MWVLDWLLDAVRWAAWDWAWGESFWRSLQLWLVLTGVFGLFLWLILR